MNSFKPNIASRLSFRWSASLPGRLTRVLLLAATLAAARCSYAQTATLTDIGTTAPTPGPNDIAQLTLPAGANNPDGLNYYFDNGTPPGQTFTTGANSAGYILTSLTLGTAGNGANLPAGGQTYVLSIYSVSGTTATLVTTYTSQNIIITQLDWLQWTGLSVSLLPNTQYAYSFSRTSSGWENMANVGGNVYAGGEVALIPKTGGTMTLGSSHSYDASFDIGLVLPAAPIPGAPLETPAYGAGGILAGTKLTMTASANGAKPISYYWQTDGGSGGALTNIPGATGTNLVVDTTGFALGTYQYDFVAGNAFGSTTSVTNAINIVSTAMVDVGSNTPTPGPIDITQLITTNYNVDGMNYYTDNGAGHGNWCGQTFTTGTNNNGYLLQSLTWKSGGGTMNSFSTWQLYDLYFYSISSDGKTATLVGNYLMYGGGTDGNWMKFSGISVPLAPNSAYAYTFGRDASAGGWEAIFAEGNNPYSGGQIITIANANTNGGPVTYGTTGQSDQAFDLGLIVSQKPFASLPSYTPFLNPIYAATPVTLNEVGVGTPPLSYQWLSDNGTGGALVPVSGATSTNLVVTPDGTLPTINYAVIVRNTFGSSTSAPVTLNFTAPSAPQLVTDLSPAVTNQGYVGQSITYSASFTGTLPITYQWYFNSNAISSASNPSAVSNTLVLSNLQPANAGTYYLIAQNSQGSLSSSSSGLAVLTPPGPPAANTYGALVLSENPVAYWRFGESSDPSSGVLPAYDSSGNNHDGLYGATTYNGYDGIYGPESPAFAGFEAVNNAVQTVAGTTGSFVNVPPLNLNTNTVTFTAWINPAGAVAASSGIIFNRTTGVGGTAAGFGFGNNVNTAGVAELGYTWDTNSASTYNFHSGLYPVPGVWSYVALVIQTNQAKIYLYYIDPTSGLPDLYSAINPVPNGPEPFTGATNTTIGNDIFSPTARIFNGTIDEVAVFNSALSDTQILGQFSKATGIGPVAPSISGQPASTTIYAGKTITLTATGINGTPTLTYQWQFGGANLNDGGNISGSHTPTLTISNVVTADSGTYTLQVSNPVGTTPSSNAVVLVVTPVPNSYESAVLAANPFAFWKLNETNDPSTGTAVAIDYAGGYNGTYQTAAQNGFNGIVGPEAPEYAGFPETNTALETFNGVASSYVAAGSAGSLVATNLTYVMWINPSVASGSANGLLFDRGGAGEGLCLNNNYLNAAGQGALGYTWNQNNANTWDWDSGLFPTVGEWQLVAMVITPTAGTLYLIDSNGVQSATNAIPHDAETFGVSWDIGTDSTAGAGGRTFPGSIADVSVYLYALTGSQIATLYNAGAGVIPPVTLYITPAGAGTATLTWSRGTLLQSTNLAGPWTSVTTTSPYTVGTTNASTFFKVQVQ